MKIKGMPLIKFQVEDKVKKLQDGIVYMKSLDWYHNHEDLSGNTVVGDSLEAMLHVNEGKMIIPELEEEIDIKDDLIMTSNSNDFVLCMLGVVPNKEGFEFSDQQKNELLSFGDTALLILDHDEFIRRVVAAADERKYKVYGGFVKYYDEKNGSCIFVDIFRGWDT